LQKELTSNMTHDLSLSRSTTPGSPALDIVSPQAMKALFWRLKYLRPSAALFHAPFLFWLTEAVRPRVVVDLGCGEGVAHFTFCQAVDKLNLDARCIGIDAWAGGVPPALNAYNAEQYEECGTLMQGEPADVVARFPEGSVDLLHVGLPLDETLIETLQTLWLPKLSDHGILILQGTGTQPLSARARDLLRPLEQAHPVIRFDHGEGMLAVLTGGQQPDRVMKLAGLGFGLPGHAEAQHIFRRLGTALHLEWQARSESDRADRLQRQLDDLAQGRAAPAPAPKAEPKPAPRAEPKPEPKPAPKPEPKPEPAPRAEAAPAPTPMPRRPEPKAPPRAEAKPEPQPAATLPDIDLLAELTRALSEATEKTLQQREELALLNAELAQRDAGSPEKLDRLEMDLSQARAEAQHRISELASLRQEAESLRAERDRLRGAEAEMARLNADLMAARQRAEEMERLAAENAQRYTDVMNSTSWKITKPARSLILMTRRHKDDPPPSS
jgi:outer membrane biosynthesis protein TonB